jgi:DNA-binding transcriptional ArsR family regulator
MDLSKTLRALSDPTRRSIVELLRSGDVAAGDLAAQLGMSRPAISKHLAVLRDAGLAVPQRRGRHQIYRLDAEPLGELREWLERHHPAAGSGTARRRRPAARPAPAPEAEERDDGWRCW